MPKTWYHLKVILDRSTKTFSVYLNGKLIAKDVTAYSPDVENINAIVLISDHAGVKVYYDDVKVFELSQTPYTSTLTQTYIPTQTYTQTLPITSESYCSNGYWRYIFEDALKCALTEEELSRISNLANQLKGETIQESAWNILEWLDKNIEYDYYKASLPAPIIWKYPDGRIKEVTGGEGTEIQTPYETIQRGKGVCSDYTILTTALLLEMGYSPVYVFDINFENSETGHTATAIKINGEYFILDQHPPVMDLGTYYTDLSTYRQETLGERLFISNATIYEVKKDRSGVLVEKVETLSAEDFKQRDYKFSFVDITKISEDLKRMFKEHYHNLILDTNIANLDKRSYLPVGYSDGVTWRMEFPHYADFYNPVFHEQFVEYLFTSFTDDLRLKYDLQRFNRFWVKLEQEGDSLKIILNLAKK
nr:transglutaminase-like domain-containing protein [Thermococcus alcaliphilus]